MGKSRRHKRKGGRTTPKGTQRSQGTNASAATTFFGPTYQKTGAIGVLLATAELAARAEDPDHADRPDTVTTGSALVGLMQDDPSKLAGNVLAAISNVWPNEMVREAARTAAVGRQNQMAGLLRTLDAAAVECAWRLTDEYGDVAVHFFELRSGGRFLFTLAAQTHEFRRSWVRLELLNVPAEQAPTHYVPSDEPGKPRSITQKLTRRELRFESWSLTSRREIESENPANPVILSWVARMLEVDVEFPSLPDFGPSDVDDSDEQCLDVAAEIDAFLLSGGGRPWRSIAYEELVDHLGDYEWGARAMKWSPARVEDFLLFQEHDLDVSAQALPALLRQWVRHCAKLMGQRKPLLKAVLDEIDRCEPLFFASRGHADVA